MSIALQLVPAAPYGDIPRVTFQVVSGYRAGSLIESPDEKARLFWADRNQAMAWAVEAGYTVVQ